VDLHEAAGGTVQVGMDPVDGKLAQMPYQAGVVRHARQLKH
jgi:hypothetical protein